ncbi:MULTISPECIES: hypothetical protein [unclassified Desulfovibrio]|nr:MULTISPECIES: hypothetical protein [unclassified Desulfovibrio]
MWKRARACASTLAEYGVGCEIVVFLGREETLARLEGRRGGV